MFYSVLPDVQYKDMLQKVNSSKIFFVIEEGNGNANDQLNDDLLQFLSMTFDVFFKKYDDGLLLASKDEGKMIKLADDYSMAMY